MSRRNVALYVALLAVMAGVFSLSRRARHLPVRSTSSLPVILSTAKNLSPDSLTPWGVPKGHESEGRLLRKSHHECFHDSRLRISRWVAYRAEGEAAAGTARYSGQFYAETGLAPGQRAEPADYKNAWKSDKSGYDRGHQAPDATIKRFGSEAQRETYSLANITPQHSQINQGVWSDVEAAIRTWSSPQRPVWVVTGPVFFADQETTWVGPDRVAVPHAYYVIATRGGHDAASCPPTLAFLVLNTTEAPWYSSLARFLVSVDSIEKLAGLDFMTALPDSIEKRIEARAPRNVWP